MVEKAVYSVDEVAEILGISRSLAFDLARQHRIPCLRLGRRIVIPKSKFTEWLNKETEKPPQVKAND